MHQGMMTFKLGAGWVIPGLEEGVWTMKPGGKRKVQIPPTMAYGNEELEGGKVRPMDELTVHVANVDYPPT